MCFAYYRTDWRQDVMHYKTFHQEEYLASLSDLQTTLGHKTHARRDPRNHVIPARLDFFLPKRIFTPPKLLSFAWVQADHGHFLVAMPVDVVVVEVFSKGFPVPHVLQSHWL